MAEPKVCCVLKTNFKARGRSSVWQGHGWAGSWILFFPWIILFLANFCSLSAEEL